MNPAWPTKVIVAYVQALIEEQHRFDDELMELAEKLPDDIEVDLYGLVCTHARRRREIAAAAVDMATDS